MAYLTTIPPYQLNTAFLSSLPLGMKSQSFRNRSSSLLSSTTIRAWLPLPSRRPKVKSKSKATPLPAPAVRALFVQFVNHELARRRATNHTEIEQTSKKMKTQLPWWKRPLFTWAARIFVGIVIVACIAPGIASLVT